MTSTTARAPNRPRTDLDPHLPGLRTALEQQRGFRVEQLGELTSPAARVHESGTPHALVQEVLLSSAAAALADIDRALRRMDAGTYGRCVRCATAVGLERLEVLPAADLCMDCQRAGES